MPEPKVKPKKSKANPTDKLTPEDIIEQYGDVLRGMPLIKGTEKTIEKQINQWIRDNVPGKYDVKKVNNLATEEELFDLWLTDDDGDYWWFGSDNVEVRAKYDAVVAKREAAQVERETRRAAEEAERAKKQAEFEAQQRESEASRKAEHEAKLAAQAEADRKDREARFTAGMKYVEEIAPKLRMMPELPDHVKAENWICLQLHPSVPTSMVYGIARDLGHIQYGDNGPYGADWQANL